MRFILKWTSCIDPWSGNVVSGDQDGNDVRMYAGEDLHRHVTERFAPEDRDEQGPSAAKAVGSGHAGRDSARVPGPAVHRRRTDLRLALTWVRPGGWICGHDYEMNTAKTQNVYEFGVKRAFGEFCRTHGFRVRALMLDGCVSFAIRR